jgi:protein-S-isoprenylcysteine O-methyltransferase Ste14
VIRARAAALAVGAVGLLGLVALASQRPLLRARTHAEANARSDWGPALLMLLALAGLAVLVYGMRPSGRARRPKMQAAAWRLIGILTIVIVVSLLLHQHHNGRAATPVAPAPSSGLGPPTSVSPAGSARRTQSSGPTWWEIAGVAAAAGLALLATRFTRRQQAGPDRDDHAGRLAALLDDSLDDLRRDPDARRAVIATYARMERGLAACGLNRDPADTPLEYLSHILAAHRVSEPAAARLTDLFEQAKFSQHVIDEDIRREAVAALEAVRAELGAADLVLDGAP